MKHLKIKKFKPQFTTVITTLNVYEEDLIQDGVVVAPKGTLKLYQTVIATGPSVREIKEGDLVLLNLQDYVKKKYKNNSIKEDISEMETEYIYDFPKMVIDGKLLGKFQDRDIDGVIAEFEEEEVENKKQNTFFN
jgi:uncharacterized protein YeeX (DUF496 family)